MKNSNKWPVVEEKMEELRSLTEEQWETGGWELAALGERVLETMEYSKLVTGYLREQTEALRTATDSLTQVVGHKKS